MLADWRKICFSRDRYADKAAERWAQFNDRLAIFGMSLKLGKDVNPIPKNECSSGIIPLSA